MEICHKNGKLYFNGLRVTAIVCDEEKHYIEEEVTITDEYKGYTPPQKSSTVVIQNSQNVVTPGSIITGGSVHIRNTYK